MDSSTTLKKKIHDLSRKGIDITQSKSMTNAAMKAALDPIEGEINSLMTELESAEFIEEKRKSFGIDQWSGGSNALADAGAQTKTPSLTLSEDQLHQMFDAAKGQKSFRVQVKGVTEDQTALGLRPNVLIPGILERRHEVRLLQRFPVTPMAGPTVEYIQHSATTGTAGTLAAGDLKPEVKFTAQQLIATARKIAAFTAITDELLADFDTWATYVQSELRRAVIDAENTQLLLGDGTGNNLTGLLKTTGILTRSYTADKTADATINAIDTIERAIADLRIGQALVDATDVVLHPTTWSNLRRLKDSQGRYLVNPDPTVVEAQALFGIPVFTTTTMPVGKAVVANLSSAATVLVRSGLELTSSNSHADYFQRNLTAYIAEERIALAVSRPAAVVLVSDLP